MRKRNLIALLAAGALALPAGAFAQGGHQHGQQETRPGQESACPMGGMGMGMMGMQGRAGQAGMMGRAGHPMMHQMTGTAGPSPAMILAHREALGLTDEQVERLEALQERAADARQADMEAMQALHEKLAAELDAPELDLEAYESALEQMADRHVAMAVAMARTGQEAVGVLTEEQRSELRVGMRFMHGMMRMMGGSSMGSEATMRGGMGSMGMMGSDCPMMGGARPPGGP